MKKRLAAAVSSNLRDYLRLRTYRAEVLLQRAGFAEIRGSGRRLAGVDGNFLSEERHSPARPSADGLLQDRAVLIARSVAILLV